MRIRQICLVAEQLEPTLETLGHILGVPVLFRDPDVAHFVLANGLFLSGGDFIEVVSPLPGQNDTAAGRHLARRGESFYMVIFQCADAAPLTRKIAEQGVRPVWTHDADGLHATHFHPRDFGGAIVSVDSMGTDNWQTPEASWYWAHWPDEHNLKAGETPSGALAGLTFVAPDPQALSHHWATLLERPHENLRVDFDGATLWFETASTDAPHVSQIHLKQGCESTADILARAAARGLLVTDNKVRFCGVDWVFGA